MSAMEKLLRLMAERQASDVYLSVGSPILIRINGQAIPVNGNKMDLSGVKSLLNEIIKPEQWVELERENELNTAYGLRGVGSFRISSFRQRGTIAAVIRYIPGEVPSFEALKLPSILSELILEPRGLILIVGGTGSGKTTTLAGMIDYRNSRKAGHILTIEDPIEFNFRNKMSIVNQREIGTDCKTLDIALKNALRQAPDCIMIGEIRDGKTMAAAVSYAQSGHLCIATLHANNAAHALNRIYSLFPIEARDVLKGDLASTLRAIVAQRLVKSASGNRRAVNEIMLNTGHITDLITKGSVAEIKDQMERSLAPGSKTFEQALAEMVRSGDVAQADAMAMADSPTNLMWMLNNGGGAPTTSSPTGAAPTQAAANKPAQAPAATTSIGSVRDSQQLFAGISLD